MKPLSDRELAIFCEQTAMIIKSGMLLHSGIQMIKDDTTNPERKNLFQQLENKLAENSSFAHALKSVNAFPHYMIHMVEIGTKSGKLDIVMNSLAGYYDRLYTMKKNIKSAIVYSSILIIMMLLVLVFLAAKVLPVFEQVFNNLGTQMSPWAASIMKLGSWINEHSWLFITLIFIIVIFCIFFIKTETSKAAFAKFIAGKKVSEKFSLAVFTSALSLMLSSGLDMQHCLQLSAQAVPNRMIKEKITKALQPSGTETFSFIKAMERLELFSNSAMGILSMGSHTGSIDSAVKYVADLYEEEYQTILIKKVSLIEPISVTIISVLTGSVLLSVMFPLLGILSAIG